MIMGSFSVEGTFELYENLSIMSAPLVLMRSKKYEVDTNGVSTVSKGGGPLAPTMRYAEFKFLDQILKFMLICLGYLAKVDIT